MMTMHKTLICAILMSLLITVPAWALKGDLGYTGTSRTDTYVLSVNHQIGPWSFYADYRYGETDDVTTTDQGYLNVIYDHKFSDRWSVAGGNKTGFNSVRGIDVENFLGAGPKYYIVRNDTTKLSFSVWYLSQYTEYSDKDSEAVHRMSYRPKFSYRKGAHEVKAVFYYQPSLDEPDDYFTIAEASYSVKISDTQSVGFRFKDEYRSTVEGVKHETLKYIGWSFKL